MAYFQKWNDGDLLTAEKLNAMAFGENLLDNWYWVDPVNQRGETEYSQTAAMQWKFGLDRFRFYSGTLKKADRGWNWSTLKTATYKRITQRTEFTLEAGKSYVLSVLAKVNDVSGANAFRPCTNAYGGIGGSVQQATFSATGRFEVYSTVFTPSQNYSEAGFELLTHNDTSYIDIDIEAWKVEEGTKQTIAHLENGNWVLNDPPPNKQQELAKCQWYYEEFAFETLVFANGEIDYSIPLKVTKRTNLTSSNCIVRSVNGTVGCVSCFNGTNWIDYPASVQPVDVPTHRNNTVRACASGLPAGYHVCGIVVTDCNL